MIKMQTMESQPPQPPAITVEQQPTTDVVQQPTSIQQQPTTTTFQQQQQSTTVEDTEPTHILQPTVQQPPVQQRTQNEIIMFMKAQRREAEFIELRKKNDNYELESFLRGWQR